MRLTIYGRGTVVKMLVLTLLIDIVALVIPLAIAKLILLFISVLLFCFTLFFFRDPIRKAPDGINENHILAPADGKVMMIEEVENENIFLKSKAKLIGIFLSPLNVHVNRIPFSGVVDFFHYVKGDYIVAFDHKSSDRNERTLIGIENNRTRILMKQIAGFIARRIICDVNVNKRVVRGEKFGMIKFGSRVDVLVPDNSKILVSVKQRVVGGETILAEVLAQ